jgi:CheY-like chemotaxis protein
MLLRTYIDNELERLVTAPLILEAIEEPPRNPKTGDRFEDACNEPGQGQLVHLRYLIDQLESMRRYPENQISETDIIPAARLFPLDALSELIKVAQEFDPEYGHRIDEHRAECRNLRAVINRVCPPDILVVDLALSSSEADRALAAGGGVSFNENEPDALPDPREVLRSLTGFKVLRAYSRSIPVIISSYMSNPLVAQHCLVNGAFAYIRKPVLSKTDNAHDFRRAAEIGITAMDKSAKMNTRSLDVIVTHYLTSAVSEVLKAMYAKWISSLHASD